MFHVLLPDPKNLPVELTSQNRWIVWRAEQRGNKVAKIPCNRSGVTASMNEHQSSFADAMHDARRLRIGRECYSVGFVFGEGCGVVALDLDGARGSEHEAWFIGNHPTWAETSLSGIGSHLFYIGCFEGKKTVNVDGIKIEVFGTRGFIAITGARIDGTPMEMARYPVDVLAGYLAKPKSIPQPSTNGHNNRITAFGAVILREDCEKILASIDGQKHDVLRDAAYHAGHFIPACYSHHEAEEALRDAIARRGEVADMKAAWHTIETGLRKGAEHPEEPPEAAVDSGVDLSGWICLGSEESEESLPRIEDPGPFPVHLLVVPGFIGEVMAYTAATCQRSQPVLALGGAICLMATLCGRKVRDRFGTRPNLYAVGVAGSGFGKEATRQTNKTILIAAGAAGLFREGPASYQGIIAAVKVSPSVLYEIDEIGLLLQSLGNSKNNRNLSEITTKLMELYTSSKSLYKGDSHADSTKDVVIDQPCLVVWGCTTPQSFFDAFTESSISGGLIGRMVVFEAGEKLPPILTPDEVAPPPELIQVAKKWIEFSPGGGNLAADHPRPFCVPIDDEAAALLARFADDADAEYNRADSKIAPVWVRAGEKARKLALIHACSRASNPNCTRIDSAAALWAIELSAYLTRRLIFLSVWNVAENIQENNILKIEKLIISSGENGLTMKQLYDKTRWIGKRERAEAIDHLSVEKKIRSTVTATGGRNRTTFFCI